MPDSKLPVNYCTNCGLVHPPLITCEETMRKNMVELLMRVGSVDSCRGCSRTIYWVRHANGHNAPYTEAGLNHFIDCPQRDQFKRPKGA